MAGFGQLLWRLQTSGLEEAAGDGELLRQFLSDRAAPAFETIIRRHGPLVLRICQRELPVQQDAEDAFQATFLLLAQKAGTIRQQASLAPWLAGVARRLSRRLGRQLRQQRQRLGQLQHKPTSTAQAESPAWWDDERRHLPQEYQTVIDLCLIQGLTREEAAHKLGQSPSAVHGMLYRARLKLKKQLLQRGTVAGSALLATQTASSAIDRLAPPLALAAVKVLEQGTLHSAMVSPTIIALLQGKSLTTGMVALILTGSLVLTGVGIWGMQAWKQPASHAAAVSPISTGLPLPAPFDDSPPVSAGPASDATSSPLWANTIKWLSQFQQRPAPQQLSQSSQQLFQPPDDKVQQAGQAGVPLPNQQAPQQQQSGKGAARQTPVIPVPPADRVPSGSERVNLARHMVSASASVHEGIVALLPRPEKQRFDGKELLVSLILTEEEYRNCTDKAPRVEYPRQVQVANDPAWDGGLFQVDWKTELLLVAVILEQANSVTLTTVDKCWIPPDAQGVGHLLLTYSGKEPVYGKATYKSYPYVMIKLPRQSLQKVAVTVWRSGEKPDAVTSVPR